MQEIKYREITPIYILLFLFENNNILSSHAGQRLEIIFRRHLFWKIKRGQSCQWIKYQSFSKRWKLNPIDSISNTNSGRRRRCFFNYYNIGKYGNLQSLSFAKKKKSHLPRMFHILRFIHSDSKLDFQVLIRTVFGNSHFVPFRLFGAIWCRMKNNLKTKF